MKKISFSILLCLFFMQSYAQQEIGTYFLDRLHHASALNPSFDADNPFVVALPSAYGMSHQRGLSLRNLINGKVTGLIGSRNNQILFGGELSIFKISFKKKNIRYNFGHNYKGYSDLQFSNPLVSIILNGNSSFIGGTAIASPQWHFSSYSETVFGMSFVNDFSFGFNIKLLNGLQNISTARSEFSLGVNDDIYQLDLESSFLLNSSFPIDFSNLSNINLFDFQILPGNYGAALDLGMNYRIGKFSLSASVIDIGFLNWKEQVHNYNADGNFVYDGAEFSDILSGDFNFLDTIGGILEFVSTENSYRKFVPSKYYASLSYDYDEKFAIGALVYGHQSYDQINVAFALNLQRKWGTAHALGFQYGVMGSNGFNLGISGYTTLGPIRLFGVFDNILGLANPLGARNADARVGINLVFGPKKTVLRV